MSLQIPLIGHDLEKNKPRLVNSHLVETPHCPFSSNENEDAAAAAKSFLWPQFVCTNTCHRVTSLLVPK